MNYNKEQLEIHIDEICILLANTSDVEGKEPLNYFKDLYKDTESALPGFASHCASKALHTFISNKPSIELLTKVAAFRVKALVHRAFHDFNLT